MTHVTETERRDTMQAMNFKILREFPPPDMEKAWRDYLARVEFPSHYESPEYFVEPLWPGKPRFAVLAFENEKVTGVLTGLHAGKDVSVDCPPGRRLALIRRETPRPF